MDSRALAGLQTEGVGDLLPLLAIGEDRRLVHLARRAADILRLAPYDSLGDRLAMVSEIWRHVCDTVIVTDVGSSLGQDLRSLFVSPAPSRLPPDGLRPS
jgi:hypothetical protein